MKIKDGVGCPTSEEADLAWVKTLDCEIEITTDPHWKAMLVLHKESSAVDYGIKL